MLNKSSRKDCRQPVNDGDPWLAPAKINLDLMVMARRPDGYHELDSLCVFTDLADELTIEPDESWSLNISGDFAQVLDQSERNIVERAYEVLKHRFQGISPLRVDLKKNIPVAAGMGGGSSDAATLLLAARHLFDLPLGDEELRDLSFELGADLPVCLYGRPVRMRSLGERLDPVRGLPDLPLLLINPGVALSTATVFSNLTLQGERLKRPAFTPYPSVTQLGVILQNTKNDLQESALELAPVISEVLESLKELDGLVLSRMSGSGTTCFGLFADNHSLEAACEHVKALRPDWWIRPVISRCSEG